MAAAIHVPRVNNNDDVVKLVALHVAAGAPVSKGQVVASVETDKAVVDVEAPDAGFVLDVLAEIDSMLTVGSILMWVGATADEAVPRAATAVAAYTSAGGGGPTAKARALLARLGLSADGIAVSGERLSVADIERHVAAHGGTPAARPTMPAAPSRTGADERPPEVAGELRALKGEERGMLATVLWHRDTAVPGYVEVQYDTEPWEAQAQEFGRAHGLLLNPLLALHAWRVVEVARQHPRLNATISGSQRYEYSGVNLGFTVQAGETLYLAVVRDAQALDAPTFVARLVDLQRRAAAHKLTPEELRGVTIGFSSMARWKVSRHVPILAPQTSIMIAHAVGADGRGCLGATYDHRVLSGSDVAEALRKIAKPPAFSPSSSPSQKVTGTS